MNKMEADEFFEEVGTIKLNDDFDKHHVLKSLKDKGFFIRIIERNDYCTKYGIMVKIILPYGK